MEFLGGGRDEVEDSRRPLPHLAAARPLLWVGPGRPGQAVAVHFRMFWRKSDGSPCDFLSREEKDFILGGNAERVFKLED